MPEFSFSARVQDLDLNDMTVIDALFSESMQMSPSESDGEVTLSVTAEAVDARAALDMFLAHLNNQPKPIEIVRLDLDLVNVPEIAARVNVSREIVRLWSLGQRLTGFPTSFTSVGESRLWAWADIYSWLLMNRKKPAIAYGDVPLPVHLVERVNGMIARQRLLKDRTGAWTQSRLLVAPSLRRSHRATARQRPFGISGQHEGRTSGLVSSVS